MDELSEAFVVDTTRTTAKTETAVAPVEPKAPAMQPSVIQAPSASGNYVPTIWNNKEMMNAAYQSANLLSKTDMIPAAYRGKPGNCFIAIDMAARMNVSPLLVMGMLNIVQGNAGWNGQGCIALINNCGRFTPIKFEEELKPDGYFSCIAYATDKASGEVLRSTKVDRTLAQACGWLDKNGSYWKKMPQQMARYRAAAFFARAYCPDALMGLYTDDELRDISGNYNDGTNKVKLEMGA